MLYWILYPINNLRVAVETAKRVLTKERIDRQRMGQSSTSPFMKASQESKRSYEKGVTFDALETIEGNSDSIDKLTSLVNKMNIKMDEKESQYKPRVYQGRNRGCSYRQDNYRSRERSYSRDHVQYIAEEEITLTEVTGLIIELGVNQEMIMEIEGMTGLIIDKATEEKISEEIMVSKDIE